ncbi:MAG TPA: hypothetical protein VE442_05200 [Jatrophihabitans sp.]|nr:hypothetical protein [Jatrophihabitans sp.]
MNGQNLRTTAGLTATVAAAAAGALTVGLISGVVHTASQAQGTTTTAGNSTTSNTSTSSKSRTTGGSSTGRLGSVNQNAAPVAGSNGS